MSTYISAVFCVAKTVPVGSRKHYGAPKADFILQNRIFCSLETACRSPKLYVVLRNYLYHFNTINSYVHSKATRGDMDMQEADEEGEEEEEDESVSDSIMYVVRNSQFFLRKQEPQGALIAHLSTMSTSVKS